MRLDERHLLVAKRVARALDIHKTVALDMLAKAGGAASYYYMRQLIQDALTPEVRPSTVEKLRPYHPLLLGGSSRQAPDYEAILATVQFAKLLAKEADTASVRLLDGVFASLWQANNWDELSARHIKKVLEPLYQFVVPPSGTESGRFVWSDECHYLSRELRRQEDLWNTRYAKDGVETVYEEADKAIRRLAGEHPTFLEAGVTLAKITMAEESPDRAVEIVGEYIERAEALIPPDYTGYIEPKHTENLPYLWLLSTAAEAHFEAGAAYSAAQFEEKLRRVHGPAEDPSADLALLWLASGEARKAMEALSSLDSLAEGYAAATRAFVYFGYGQLDAFRNQFVRALFTMPWLRAMVVEYDQRPAWDGRCGPIPLRFAELGDSALYHTRGLRDVCLNLLDDSEIQNAEFHLEKLWTGDGTSENSTGNRAEWREAMIDAVQKIAPWDASRGSVEGIGTRLAGTRGCGLFARETFRQRDIGAGLRR
ncbi:hypothetical protein KAF44_30215 (plasmid) [Cupriavidus necator]|nr:hypothetical protein KAF44_30215 [Cupriavidus necator]